MLISSLAIATAAAVPGSYYWSGKNGDALRTGSSPFVAPSDLSAGPSWSYIVPGNGIARSHPLIDNDQNVYFTVVSFGFGPGGVVKFDADGVQLWMYTADSQVPNGPAMQDGRLMFVTAAGDVVQLDMESGEEVWKVRIGVHGPEDTHSTAAADGYIIAPVLTADPHFTIPNPSPSFDPPENQLVALNMSGHVLWRFEPDIFVYNALIAIVDSSVVFADTNGRTYRVDLATGRLLWKQESADYRNFTGSSTGGAVVGPNRVVYVTSNTGQETQNADAASGRLSAYALETGQLLWRQCLELPANNGGAVGRIGPDGNGPLAVVVVIGENPDFPPQHPGSKRGKVVAFDAETGERLGWQRELHWAYGAAAGDTLFHICLPDLASNPAIGGDGTVYFGFEDGQIYAVRDADGDGHVSDMEVSSYDGGNAYQGSPGIAPGMLAACPCNGLHVFRSTAVTSSLPGTVAV